MDSFILTPHYGCDNTTDTQNLADLEFGQVRGPYHNCITPRTILKPHRGFEINLRLNRCGCHKGIISLSSSHPQTPLSQ